MKPEPSDAVAPHTALFAQVRQLLNEAPFQPFRIVTTSGRTYDVPTSDHAGVLPLLRMILVARDDGSSVNIHALQVASIEPLRRRKRVA